MILSNTKKSGSPFVRVALIWAALLLFPGLDAAHASTGYASTDWALPGNWVDGSKPAAAPMACPTGNILYVNATAPGANDGSSWANAFTNLQSALNSTCPGIEEIWVAAGTYLPVAVADPNDVSIPEREATFQLKNGVALYGGFAGTETQLEDRDWAANVTILSGDINGSGNLTGNAYSVVTGSGTDATAVMDGFTITGGNADGTFPNTRGGGMYNSSGSPTVTNCTFSGNTADSRGGGMYNVLFSSPTVTNCTFSGNTASSTGGGMHNISGSSPTVTNCTFSGNTSTDNGGGMLNSSSSPMVTNCTFSGNSASNIGGGMLNFLESSPTVTNCTFSGNSAFDGGGMHNFEYSSPTVTNCTFSGNSATSNGGGMFNITSSSPTVTNCIIWGNSSGGIINASSSTPIVNYSIVQGGYTGTNNLNTDPLFVNAAGGDFRLTALSPAINAGDPATNLSLFPDGPSNPEDLDGNPRVVGADIDMGAYEKPDFNTCQTALPVEVGSCGVQLDITDGINTFNGTGETCSGNAITGEADVWAMVTIPAGNLPEDFITIQYDNSGVGPVSDIAIAVYTDCNDLAGSLMGCVDDLTVAGGMNVEGIESILIPVSGGETFYIRIINKTPQSASGKLSIFFAREIIYVNAAATGANNGSSWTDAFTDLQDALTADGLCTTVTEIWVAAGTYYPDEGAGQTDNDRNATFQLKNGVAIYGGFAGTEILLAERDWVANVTILSGDINQSGNLTGNSYTVVTGSGTNATAVIDGFTITGGNADGTTESVSDPNSSGGGMYINTGSPTVTNCTFSGNSASAGGGMANIQSSPTVTNCTFSGNTTTIFGGGMYNSSSSPTVTNCTFSGNSAITGGGMLNLSFSDPKVTNCTFSGNTASFGGGGGMYNQDCSLKVTNCTFSGNTASFGDGGGMRNNFSSPTVTNCIIWNNTAGGSTTTASASVSNSSSTPTFRHSLIANSGGSGSWDSAIGTDGGNNIDADPLFVNPLAPGLNTGGDYSLQVGSPAIDAGDAAAWTATGLTTDASGNTRPVGIVDMGAFESQVVCPTITAPTVTQPTCATPTGTIVVNATGIGALEYSVDNGMNWGTDATFSGQAPSNYHLKVRLQANPSCEATYASNPVVLDPPFTASTTTDTWTGCVSTDWAVAGNWADGSVPTVADDVIIPSVPANQPIISTTATAKSLEVMSGASLSISGGILTIDDSKTISGNTVAFFNMGTVNSNGQVLIGNSVTANVGKYGIRNEGTFNNNSGGVIEINRSTDTGLYNEAGSFTNSATIMIGASAAIGKDGLFNRATFTNNSPGLIQIDRSFSAGISNLFSAKFTNSASIVIGSLAQVGTWGLLNQATFTNNSGGSLSIDRATSKGLENGGLFTNAAAITIGEVASIVGSIGLYNRATFQNSTCAVLTNFAPVDNSSNFLNAGFFTSNTSNAHANSGTLNNNGIILYPVGNPIPNVTNNEIIVAPVTANTCDVISPAFDLGSPVDFTIMGIFTDEAATMSAGTFETASNTFTPTVPLVDGMYSYFVQITDPVGGCTRVLPWDLTTENCIAISGNIVWEHDGTTPVPDATVTLSGDDMGNNNTDANGDYAIPTFGGNLTLTPTKTTGDPYEGVDVADVTRIQQHVTFIDRLDDGYKVIAADVNESNSVTGLDAAVVFHAINGNPSAQAIFETPSWRFVEATHTFTDENAPWTPAFPEDISLTNVMADVLNQDFVGVKMGDVNGTWGAPLAPLTAPLNWTVPNLTLKVGQTLRLPFRANGLPDVAAWQFALRFDTDYLRFERALPTAAFPLKDENFGAWQAGRGELRSVFAVPQGLVLPKGEVLFELEFQVVYDGLQLSEVLRLAEDVLLGRVYNTALDGGAVALTFEVVETRRIASLLPGEAALGFALEQNMPNPFSNETLVRFELPEAGEAVFTVHDVQGRLLYEQRGFLDAGLHEVRLDAARLGATGVLSYTLRSGAHSATRRMVLVR